MNSIYNFNQFLASPGHSSSPAFLIAFENFVNEYMRSAIIWLKKISRDIAESVSAISEKKLGSAANRE